MTHTAFAATDKEFIIVGFCRPINASLLRGFPPGQTQPANKQATTFGQHEATQVWAHFQNSSERFHSCGVQKETGGAASLSLGGAALGRAYSLGNIGKMTYAAIEKKNKDNFLLLSLPLKV